MEDPVVPLERNLYGHPLAGLPWERQLEKILLKHGWEKVSNWECFFVHRQKGLFFYVYVEDIKLAGKKQNFDPMWKELNKEVDLGEPTSFLDHVFLGSTHRQCEMSKEIVDNRRAMFESRISAGRTEKLPYSENFRISSWSYDMAGHAKKCVERCCELANKTKTKYACIVEADESLRKRMEGSLHKNREDRIAGSGIDSLKHCNLVHKFIPVPQAMKIPDAKAAVDKDLEKLEKKIRAWQLTKVRKQKRGDREIKERMQTSTFCVVNGRLSSQDFGVGTPIPEIQRPSCTPR